MEFNRAADIEQECWTLRLADRSRAIRRSLIDDLFNGLPPYTPEEVAQNNITVNTSNLTATRIHATATSQCKNALLTTNEYFSVKVDRGPSHRRQEYSEIITSELRKAMKSGASALKYIEKTTNVCSSMILHGPGVTNWSDPERWCGSMQAIADVLIPSRTLVSMENLEHFAVYRRWTPTKLWQMTHDPPVDPAWNVKVAEQAIEWARKQQTGTDANDYSTGFSPERLAEDMKENGFIWSTDQVPTINAYDFYATDCDEKDFGWRRRIILDCPDVATQTLSISSKNINGERGQFLYNSGDRRYASSLGEILHFQIGDGSVVSPRRYHSQRGLGFLLYSVCHLQNRLYCSLSESAFEAAMQYFRANSQEDVDRLLKVALNNRKVIPDGVNFMPQAERWQVNEVLLQNIYNLNKETIADSSTGYNRNFGHEDQKTEKTATQITAEVNASSAILGAIFQDLYRYQKYECIEIARRFCIKDSRDVDVRNFRAACIRRGVPEEVLNHNCWEISVEQVMGNGNRQLAIAQAQMEMAIIDRLDPDSQRKVLRGYLFATSNDPARALDLVPLEQQSVTNSTHDAELSAARMLLGLSMGLKQGVNHGEYTATLLASMQMTIQMITQRGMATMGELAGLQITAGQSIEGQPIPGPAGGPGNGVMDHINILAQNKEDKQQVKQLSDVLGKLMNEVKGFAQRLQEQQAEHNGNGQVPPEQQAKIAAEMMKGQAKIKLMADTHAQKARQKEQSHAQKLQEKAADSELQRALELRKAEVSTAATDLTTAAEIQRQALKGDTETAKVE